MKNNSDTVSQSNVEEVRCYISSQKEHQASFIS